MSTINTNIGALVALASLSAGTVEPPRQHADLTKKVQRVDPDAVAAARVVHAKGGSPRAQLDAARDVAGKRLVYTPHVGAKQRAKEARRAAKAQQA